MRRGTWCRLTPNGFPASSSRRRLSMPSARSISEFPRWTKKRRRNLPPRGLLWKRNDSKQRLPSVGHGTLERVWNDLQHIQEVNVPDLAVALGVLMVIVASSGELTH